MAQLMDPNATSFESDGIFIQEAKITNVTKGKEDPQYPKQMNYVLELEFEKKAKEGSIAETYKKNMYLTGNLLKNGNIPLNLTNFLYAVGIANTENLDKLVEDFSTSNISKELKELLIGKKIMTLQFVSGTYTSEKDGTEKPSYKFWNMQCEGFKYPNLFSTEIDNKIIREEFKKKCESSYPPKYTPEVLTANTETKQEDTTEEEDLI